MSDDQRTNWIIGIVAVIVIVVGGFFLYSHFNDGNTAKNISDTTTSENNEPEPDPVPTPSSCYTAAQAWDHIGEVDCVRYYVASPFFSASSSTTLLNEKSDYTNGFTSVIFESDLSKFNNPVSTYGYKNVEVSGLIKMYAGHPEIILETPSQIQIVN